MGLLASLQAELDRLSTAQLAAASVPRCLQGEDLPVLWGQEEWAAGRPEPGRPRPPSPLMVRTPRPAHCAVPLCNLLVSGVPLCDAPIGLS